MRYLQKSFTLPVSQGVSQQEWDRVFGPKDDKPPVVYYDKRILEAIKKNLTFPRRVKKVA